MNLRDPKIQKIIVGVLVVVIASYVYFGTTVFPFCYQVRKAKIAELDNEYEKLSADLEKARKTVGNLARLEAEYERLHEQWLSAQELLPSEEEMPELLRNVTTAGNRSGIEFMLFQPGSPVAKEIYKEHPIKVEVRGGYHQLGVFLSRLANMSRIVNVSDLNIEGNKESAKGKSQERMGTITAGFTLKAYTLVGGAASHDEDA